MGKTQYFVYQEPTETFKNYLKKNKVRFELKKGGLGNIEKYLIVTKKQLTKRLKKAKPFKGIASLTLSKFKTRNGVNGYIKPRFHN